jgi:hypothetical protein
MAKQSKPKEFYTYSPDGAYTGPVEAETCPSNATDKKPPLIPELDKTPVLVDGEWVVMLNSDLIKASSIRVMRDKLLAASDYTQLSDSPVDAKAWAEYRQELRDLPKAKGWPNMDLPKVPTGPAVALKA